MQRIGPVGQHSLFTGWESTGWLVFTTGPNDLMKNIHDRMPVILEPGDYSTWLDPDNQATTELKQLLKPYPAAAMAAHHVSPRVNTAKYDDPALIEPFESAA